ncbi:MAG: pyridoxal phosphate-dependent aminotransferase [Lachnospiraceae bacterium]|nr:pyridoxal phosphate-dependent aminotransferase [Lachnospiraceae bacterium]
MGEKNLDFDTVVDRRNTYSLKYDFAEKRGKPKDVLPLWVADMDFKVSSYIIEALDTINNHGIYGYSEGKEEYFDALSSWLKRHYDWDVSEEWLIKTPGVVFALAMAVQAFTEEGDAVLIQQPVYYPFSEVIEDNDRRIVRNDLVQGPDGRYHIDFEDFEKKIVEENVKLFLLCNPHNPVGRVWTGEELTRLGDICLKHKVIVVSDEIHSAFVFKGKHTVFTGIKEEYKEIGIVCTSPSKTFNIAGLQTSNIFIANEELRKKFRRRVNAAGYSQLNLAGLAACEAAYRHGDEWLDAVLKYIKENADYTKAFLQEKLPKVKMTELEGTYLVWLDFREYGLQGGELDKLIINKAGLWLDSGSMFGKVGDGFQRINIACPRKVLAEALQKLASALESEIK